MTSEAARPWWSYTKDEQKRRIEAAVDSYLADPTPLTDREKLLLRDAIGHTARGLFGMAAHDLYEAGLPESTWSPTARVKPEDVRDVDRALLSRCLDWLQSAPTQMRPYFT
jgi:hypothetical protein